jgi:DNA-binding CsgD family transcriptional regulator
MFAGRLAVGGDVLDVARTAQRAPRPRVPSLLPDVLLDWLVMYFTHGYVPALPALRRVLAATDDETSAVVELRWLFLASTAAYFAWDDERSRTLSDRLVELSRGTGALSEIPIALSSRAISLLFHGDLIGAASMVDELQVAREATGSNLAPYAELGLAAMRGDATAASALIEATVNEVSSRGEGNGLTVTWWAEALLYNGISEYRKALDAAQRAAGFPLELGASNWAPVELVEAAVRSGALKVAVDAAGKLDEMTKASGTDWALGLGARSRALISDGPVAEKLYRESIERLGRTRVRTELARAHLLYGEWLRRERRRTAARTELRTAHDMFETMGMNGFAERARRELKAAGIKTGEGDSSEHSDGQLTAQESQVARLARDGLSNAEIGARLFISARTVQYHLSKVFAKLGITSRSQLDRALPAAMRG